MGILYLAGGRLVGGIAGREESQANSILSIMKPAGPNTAGRVLSIVSCSANSERGLGQWAWALSGCGVTIQGPENGKAPALYHSCAELIKGGGFFDHSFSHSAVWNTWIQHR